MHQAIIGNSDSWRGCLEWVKSQSPGDKKLMELEAALQPRLSVAAEPGAPQAPGTTK